MHTRRIAALCLAALLATAGSCTLQSVRIRLPVDGAVVDDATVRAEVRVGRNFVHESGVVRLDGVDLIAALGLTPPFAGEGGVVTVGTDTVTISSFDYLIQTGVPTIIDFEFSGLSPGTHDLEAEAEKAASGELVTRNAALEIVLPFTLEADLVAAAGQPGGAESAGSEGTLVNASLGDPIAGAPVALSGGSELREGFVAAAEARITTP